MSRVLTGAITGTTARQSCVCATTTNINITTGLDAGDIIDGITLSLGDRVLVKDQTDPIENGVYEVYTSTLRASDFEENTRVGGSVIVVAKGTINSYRIYTCIADPPNDIAGINALTFQQTAGSGVDGNVSHNGTWTDNRIIRANGTSGSVVQESGLDLDDSNNISNLGYIQFSDISAPVNPSNGQGRLYKKTGNDGIFWKPDSAGSELDLTASASGGEANTASNVGITGVGLFKQKSGVDLQFKNIAAASSKVTVVNNPTNSTVDLNVSEPNINHNNLLNYVANRHIDHSAVVLTAGVGLSGGGNITVSRTFNLNIPGLTVEPTIDASNDLLAMYDASAAAHKRIFINNIALMINIGTLGVGVYKQKSNTTFELKKINSTSTSGVTTTDNVTDNQIDLSLNVLGLPTITTIDPIADWIPVYDTSAAEHKKVSIDSIVGSSNIGTIAVFRDEKPIGTNGGTFTSGAWRTRDLNISEGDLPGISLSANVITLPAGTYYVNAYASAYGVFEHVARLWNITDNTTEIAGINSYTRNTGSPSLITGFLTIASTKTFRIEHRCGSTQSNDGFGRAAGFDTEVYTVITFIRRD